MRLTEEQLNELRTAIRPGTYDGSVSARAQIVLWYHENHQKVEIAEMSGASRPTIDKWIHRYEAYGLGGLTSGKSPGGQRTIPGHIRGRVLALARQTPPEELGISHWTAGKMADYIKKTEGVSVSQPWVSRLWRENAIQPWRQGTFKIRLPQSPTSEHLSQVLGRRRVEDARSIFAGEVLTSHFGVARPVAYVGRTLAQRVAAVSRS